MKSLQLGAGLSGAAVVCMLLVGGVGPCGPSSEYGAILLFGGVVCGAIGWLASVVDLIKLAIRGSGAGIMFAVFAAFVPSVLIAATMAIVFDDPAEMMFAAWLWPPLAAAVALVNDWRRTRARI